MIEQTFYDPVEDPSLDRNVGHHYFLNRFNFFNFLVIDFFKSHKGIVNIHCGLIVEFEEKFI